MSIVQIELTVNAWANASDQLVEQSALSLETLEDAANKGALWHRSKHNGKFRRLRTLTKRLKPASEIALNYNAQILAMEAQTPTLIADEGSYSIWDKPAGMLCQGSKWSDHTTITETVRRMHGKPSFLVHRLDKAASGLLVIAHTASATKQLSQSFAERKIDKQYECIVDGLFNDPVPKTIELDVEKKAATTVVLEAKPNETSDRTWLKVRIVTGRKHQIRAHLSALDLPIVGDRLFNANCKDEEDLQLRAVQLAFECPFTQEPKLFTVDGLSS